MIKRSLLVFAALALGYAVFLQLVRVDWDTTQHLANGNRIKAERFAFGADEESATVIVGSSLAYRLAMDSFPAGMANLGFGGLSVYDGLELIRRSGRRPKQVLIETNVLFREPDRAFLDALFQPGLYQLRGQVPMMREANQPSGVLFGWLKQRFLAGRAGAGSDEGDADAEPSAVMLAEHRAKYAVVPPDSVQQRFMAMLKREVVALETAGAEVSFFEMPIAPELAASPLAEQGRALIRAGFPGHRFLRPDPVGWRTTDGLHLAKPDAARCSGWLAREVALR